MAKDDAGAAQGAPETQEAASAVTDAPGTKTMPQAAPDAFSGPLHALIDAWFADWYPETASIHHPAPPFSGARGHAINAREDLKARINP